MFLFSFNFNSHFLFLAAGPFPVLGLYQSFEDNPTSAWCTLPEKQQFLALRLDKRPVIGSSYTLATLYQWQGVFVPIEVKLVSDDCVCWSLL